MKYKLSFILAHLIGGAILLASSGVYAGSEISEGFRYTPISYLEDGFDGTEPAARVGKYGQLANETVSIEEKSVDASLVRSSSAAGTGIGMGVAPFFDTYGVLRTNSNNDKSTYVALGFVSDEWTMDEADTSDSKEGNGFSYGIGANSPSFNIEYMMSVDEESYGVTAVGLGLTSRF